MDSDEAEETSLAIAKKLIPLIIRGLADSSDTTSLAMVNSRSALDFELSMVLLDLENGQIPPDYDERLPRNLYRLLEVLEDLPRNDRDHQRKPLGHFQEFVAALTRLASNFGYQTDSRPLPLVQLPQAANELRDMAKTLSSLRRHDYARASHEMAVEEDSDDPYDQEAAGVVVEKESPLRSDNCIREDEMSTREGSANAKEIAATQFMQQADKFYDEKILPIKNKKAIRVAVLDTGVDKTESIFKAVRGRYGTSLKEMVSFTDRDSHDTHGHGTRVAALVAQIAPHVDLLIAKVCNDRTIHGVGQYVEAIKWAIEQKVHIINISASMDEDKSIRDIIKAAEAKDIIVFAAASDNQANNPRAFPASMGKVLAIHSTDGRGKICPDNPRYCESDANFSTLGERIRFPLRDRGLRDGVSYSTAIASGMAANILTLADEYLNESEKDQERRSLAFTLEGMKQVFLYVSGGRDRDGYNYVCPNKVAQHCDTPGGIRQWLVWALESR